MKKRSLAMFLALAVCLGLTIPALADGARFLEYVQTVPGGTVTYRTTVWEDGSWDGSWGVDKISPGVTELTPLTYISYKEGGVDYSGPVTFTGIRNNQIVNVVLPSGEGFTKIDAGGFRGCANLKSVTLSDTITTIGMSAFEDCPNLTTINFPDHSLLEIGYDAFSGCTSLTSITIPASVKNLSGGYTGNGSAFGDCPNLTTVVFQEGTQAIPAYTFNQCSSLTTVVIPTTVKEIGAHAFSRCEGLTSIAITPGVTTIGESAFSSCSALTDVYLPATLKEIGKEAFSNCTALENIVLPDGLTTLGEHCFSHTGLTSLVVPGSVKKVDNIFYSNDPITNIAFCEGVASISGMNDSKTLTTLTFPSSLQELDAFSDCYELTDVYYTGSEAQWAEVKLAERCYRWRYITEGRIEKTALHYNAEAARLPVLPEQPSVQLPAKPSATPAENTAYASTQNVLVDGKPVEFQAYALKDEKGNDINYVKLRDVAYALNGTAAQFSVGWDQAAKSISVTSGQSYEANGSEMKTPYSGNRAYTVSSSPLYINGKAANLGAILLTDDAGSGYTYFKLRDLGEALGFAVNWSAEKGIYIETK